MRYWAPWTRNTNVPFGGAENADVFCFSPNPRRSKEVVFHNVEVIGVGHRDAIGDGYAGYAENHVAAAVLVDSVGPGKAI